MAPRRERHPRMPLSRRRVVFTGVARNCAAHLPGVLENLARFAALYEDARFVMAVSDSTDETLSILEHWMAGRRGNVIDLGVLADRLPGGPNASPLRATPAWTTSGAPRPTTHDHLVVADLDDVMASPVSADRFVEAARWLDGDDARAGVFANAAPRYYDIWALRHEIWCAGDCWHAIWSHDGKESFEAAKFREVFARQVAIPASLPPIKVRSAFGGLGLYKMRYARAARYCGVDEREREVSEHVAFNADIGRAGGELCIFPPLQVCAPRQHLYRASDFSWPWRLVMLCQRSLEKLRPGWRTQLAQ